MFRRKARIIAAAGLACAGVLATASGAAAIRGADRAAPEPNVVKGTVRTSDGRPIVGATIRISGATGAARGTTRKATTDRSGNYRITVPLGHYDVDGFADITHDGQTYTELWLHRVNGGCERVMSNKGIVRDFVLRLSGPKRCYNNADPNNPDSYYGAYIIAMTSAFPADAVIAFTLTPVGRLADGTTGRTVTFTRTGAALLRGGGKIDETSFLHDIPLGRYRVSAEARYADGTRRPLSLDSRDDDAPEGTAIEIAFPAATMGGGFRSVNLGISAAGVGPTKPAREPSTPTTKPTTPGATVPSGPELPTGRYACSYRSQYAGDIPTSNAVTIQPGGRYDAYGGSGTYSLDARTAAVRWISGPLAAPDVRATFARRNGLPAITVVGGAASEDPDRTHFCVLSGG